MPSKSRAQHNLMEMVAHDPGAAKRVGISKSVGEDFAKADEGHKISKLPLHKAEGGQATCDDDEEQDKSLIREAIGLHDKHIHGIKPEKMNLKKGGRACHTAGHKADTY